MSEFLVSSEKVRLYALIDALEHDLTEFIESRLLATHYPEQIFTGEELEEATKRRNDEAGGEEVSLVAYLNLTDKFHVLSRSSTSFPEEEARSFQVLGGSVQALNEIRRRTHHDRPLHPGDQSKGLEAAATIVGSALPFERLRQVLQWLQADANWVPEGMVVEDLSKTLHNIPPGDFDATGLIGREEERERLRRYLIEPRHQVISVVAPGGYGKTALAVQVLHDIKDDPESPYEMIAYVSLQTETLTVRGIQAVADAVSSLDEALPRLLEPLSDEKPESIAAFGEVLDGVPCLLVIDNLETVTGSEVINFIESMPPSIRYLFTSRVGIGEIERKLPLGPLGLPQAVHMIRQLGALSGLNHLAQSEQGDLERIASRLDRVPLKIKWAVATCETGLDIGVVLANTETLDEFCVARLFESLPDNAASAAWALYAIGRAVPASQLITCLEIGSDESRAAIQELTRHMFITQSKTDRTTQVSIELSTALQGHLMRLSERGESNTVVIERAIEIDNKTQAEVRKMEADRELGRSGPNIVRGGPEHNAAKALLRRALTLTLRSNDFPGAYRLIDDAESADPDFWEVYRVRAFLMAQKGDSDATAAYETALELVPPDEPAEAAYVKHLFAGYLCRISGEQERALYLAREAAQEVPSHDTQFTLGTALQRAQELDEAIVVLRDLREAKDIPHHLKVKVTTTLLHTYRRKIDRIVATTRDIEEGLAVFEEVLSLSEVASKERLRDERIIKEIANQISELLRFCVIVDDASRVAGLLVRAMRVYETVRLLSGAAGQSGYIAGNAQRLLTQLPELESFLQPLIEGAESATSNHFGYIMSFDQQTGKGFIGSTARERRVYFHLDGLLDKAQADLLAPGALVQFEFRDFASFRGQPVPAEITVEAPAEELGDLSNRTLDVIEKMNHFGFVRDPEMGIAAFLHESKLEESIAWRDITIGTQWTGDLIIGKKGFEVSQLRRQSSISSPSV
jgi:tetratricopeptide (TPR) repeat protein